MTQHRPLCYFSRVVRPENLNDLDFTGGQAQIYVPGYALSNMPFDVPDVTSCEAYWWQLSAIRQHGFDSKVPIVMLPRASGRWIANQNGAIRLAAAKQVIKEYLPNLFQPKVHGARFILVRHHKDQSNIGALCDVRRTARARKDFVFPDAQRPAGRDHQVESVL